MNGVAQLPLLQITVGGVALEDNDLRFLSSVNVSQKLSLPALCDVAFTDPDRRFADTFGKVSGAALRVGIHGSRPLFDGMVTAVEYHYEPHGGLIMRIRGYDALYGLCKSQQIAMHSRMTLSEIMENMVADHGLKVEAKTAGPRWEKLLQYRQTDLDFLAQIGQRCGLYFTLRGTVAHLMTLQGVGEAIPLEFGKNLFEASVELNDAPALKSAYACGWDPFAVEVREGWASAPRSGTEIAANISGALASWPKERKLVETAVRTAEEAEALAQAELDRCRAVEKHISGVADGHPGLTPGRPIRVTGVAAPLEGQYVLTEVEHSITAASGFISTFSTLPPPPPPPLPPVTAVTFGVVTTIDDPEQRGRVQARLPACADCETDWMNVLLPAAGQDKGLVMLPDPGDHVLVLFSNNDPARGVVLGGIYGSATQPPDWGIEEGRVRRYHLVTAGGQQVTLDDGKREALIENTEGSFVRMSPEKVIVHSEADLELEAPGKKVVIRGSRIDFQRG